MNTVITFNAYPQNVSAYRMHGAYRVVDVRHDTTPEAEIERMLGLSSDAFLDEESGEWTNGSGNHICKAGDHSADMGDYTIISYDLSEINETDYDLLAAMRKDAYARPLAEEIAGE